MVEANAFGGLFSAPATPVVELTHVDLARLSEDLHSLESTTAVQEGIVMVAGKRVRVFRAKGGMVLRAVSG